MEEWWKQMLSNITWSVREIDAWCLRGTSLERRGTCEDGDERGKSFQNMISELSVQ
jgi:hypothetical protein